MANALSSIFQRATAYLTPAASSDSLPQTNKISNDNDSNYNDGSNGFATTAPKGKLFPQVDPAVDGEDCIRDCESCTIKYPWTFRIDEKEQLYGKINGWATHMLVATGKTDWVKDVRDEKGSVMEAVGKYGKEPTNGRLMLSASNMPVPPNQQHDHSPSAPTTVLLLPSFTLIDNVTPATVPDLITYHINTGPTTTTPLLSAKPVTLDQPLSTTPPPLTGHTGHTPASYPNLLSPAPQTSLVTSLAPPTPTSSPSPPSLPSSLSQLTARPSPQDYLILLCSQRTRDARCGQSAPLLRREFERQLRPLGLYRDLHDQRRGGVGIYFISHVGGHKYSANVMVYRRHSGGNEVTGEGKEKEGSQCIWLARVRPEDCEGIVKYTVLQGKVVKPERQLRGGFDRERGLVSW